MHRAYVIGLQDGIECGVAVLMASGAAKEIIIDVRSAMRNDDVASGMGARVRDVGGNVVCLVDLT